MDKKNLTVFIVTVIILSAIITVGFAAVPDSTSEDTVQQYNNGTSVVRADFIVSDHGYYQYYNGTLYNFTEAVLSLLGLNATNEWGLVYGSTGDWFNYTDITYTPVYLGLEMHPLNLTYDGELVEPRVYDKDDTHWQLALYWVNGTQITDNSQHLVMYYAHVDWDNVDGLEYIEPNQEPV